MNNDNKNLGQFFTTNEKIKKLLLDDIILDENILNKKILEPSAGTGELIIYLLKKLLKIYKPKLVLNFLYSNIYVNEIDKNKIKIYTHNIQNLFNEYKIDIDKKKLIIFNYDFTIKENFCDYKNFFDYIIGNPPYINFYGKQSKINNEKIRKYYLKNYLQFPRNLKNGKISLVMLFLEHSIELLKNGGKLNFIIDISFLNEPYKYIKFFIFNTCIIEELIYNISEFEGVNSEQIIIKLKKVLRKDKNKEYLISILNKKTGEKYEKKLNEIIVDKDNFIFNLNKISELEKTFHFLSVELQNIQDYLEKTKGKIRTSTMLLDMESLFVNKLNENCYEENNKYLYYKGSKSLKNIFESLKPVGCYNYNKELMEKINKNIRKDLKKRGIKNIKRIGIGKKEVFENPKLFIRQSSEIIISSFDDKKSASNNSLYILTYLKNDIEALKNLHFLNSWLNSMFITLYARIFGIIKTGFKRQPQIRISGLYKLPLYFKKEFHERLYLYSLNLTTKFDKELYETMNDYIFNSLNISTKFKKKIINEYYKLNKI